LAGGVDDGDTEKVLLNAKRLASSRVPFSIIFGGNKSIRSQIDNAFRFSNIRFYITENVYPAIDRLNILPARALIHEIFERHLVESQGMEKIKNIVDGPILPTPGAVMIASQILAKHIGDLVTVDVGGATTDVHSVTQGSPEFQEIQLHPEPESKRTVEGDLGVYVNASNVVHIALQTNLFENRAISLPETPPLFPGNEQDAEFLLLLTKAALSTAIERHVGRTKRLLTVKGEVDIIEGRDLTNVRWIVGTGGALVRIPGGRKILEESFDLRDPNLLLPKRNAVFLIDYQLQK
jgi:uncharacterized protein (TIGR01319 family)